MNAPAKKLPWTIGIGLLLIVLTLALAFVLAELKNRIAREPRLPIRNSIAEFSLTNQNGSAVSLAELRGKVWVADIIFTRCPGPCLRMTRQMKELQDSLPPGSEARLVSLTTDPDFDTPPVLKEYSQHAGANTNRWMFLTGTKKEIADLAIGSLKLSAVEVKTEDRQSPQDLFVHSTFLVIVDKHGRSRGSFETGGEDVNWAKSKQQVLAAVRLLEREK